jgi:molybdopterin molybdotransferase
MQVSKSVHLPDDPELLEAGLGDLLRTSDILLVAGGVSVSSRDFVPQVLALLGCTCLAHGVAQKPGKPLWVGTGPDGQIVFALPGNPVAVAMCFVRHVLGVLRGDTIHARSVRLGTTVAGLPTMTRFHACKVLDDRRGGMVASLARGNGSGDFLHLAGADGFLEIPPGDEGQAGSVARFWPW